MLRGYSRWQGIGIVAAAMMMVFQSLTASAVPWIDESSQTTFSRKSGKLAGGETIEISNVNFYGPIYKSLGKIVSLGVGNEHYVALLDDGTLLTWGNNKHGQLGNNTTDSTTDKQAYDITNLIHDNDSDEIERVIAVAAGATSSFALTNRGRVYWWGDGQTSPTKLRGMHGQTAESVKVDRSKGNTEAIIRTANIDPNSGHSSEQLFAWKSKDLAVRDENSGCKKDLPCAKVISGLSNQHLKDFDVSPYSGHVAILTDGSKLFTWNGQGNARDTGFVFNDMNGLDFVAAGDTDGDGRSQMTILASRSNLGFLWRDNPNESNSLPGFPISSPIKQVMMDGYDACYFLTDSGQIYMLYSNGGNDYIALDSLPKGEVVQHMYIKPVKDSSSLGTVIGLTASGRIYETSTHDSIDDVSRTRDITPELIYDTGEEGGQIDYISFGGSDVDSDDIKYKDGDNTTISVVVPGQVREGTVNVIEHDIDGNQILLGTYTYDDPTPDPKPDPDSPGNGNEGGGDNNNDTTDDKPAPNPNKKPGSTDNDKKLPDNNTLKDMVDALNKRLQSNNKLNTNLKAQGESTLLSTNPNKIKSINSKISAPNTGV